MFKPTKEESTGFDNYPISEQERGLEKFKADIDYAPPAPRKADIILAELRSVIDQREQLAAQDRTLSARKSELEGELMAFHDSTGVDSIKAAGLSVSFDSDVLRAKYDPEKWDDIVKWAFETDHGYIVQRRLTDAKVIDLIKQGVPLPDGLSVEQFTKLSTRRLN